MRSARSAWRSWCTDRLIATRMRRPWSRQARACRQAASMTQFAERADQAVALGDRDEHRRADHAALRVVPAHQRFGAGDLAARRVDLGLVVELELVARQRQAQVAQQLDLFARVAEHARLEEREGRAAVALGVARRRVGARHRAAVRCRPAGRSRCRSNTSSAPDVLRCRRARPRAEQALRERGGLVPSAFEPEQQHELVAARTRAPGRRSDTLAQALGHLPAAAGRRRARPNESFTGLKPSRPTNSSASCPPRAAARRAAASSCWSKCMRLGSRGQCVGARRFVDANDGLLQRQRACAPR